MLGRVGGRGGLLSSLVLRGGDFTDHHVIFNRSTFGLRHARDARAGARRVRMTVEVVAIGERKSSPYADSTPEERLAAAVRLIEHHQALRGGYFTLPRSASPGETLVAAQPVAGAELG